VVIYVKRHPFFERHEDDLLCEIPIFMTQAALGASIKVPTIDGHTKMSIPQGTQPHTILRLKGKGLPNLENGDRGDQFVKVVVKIPKDLSQKEEKLLREFERAHSGGHGKTPPKDKKKKQKGKRKASSESEGKM